MQHNLCYKIAFQMITLIHNKYYVIPETDKLIKELAEKIMDIRHTRADYDESPKWGPGGYGPWG